MGYAVSELMGPKIAPLYYGLRGSFAYNGVLHHVMLLDNLRGDGDVHGREPFQEILLGNALLPVVLDGKFKELL